jgi:hypothetical protein
MLAQPIVVATVVCPGRMRALGSPAVPAAFRRLWAAYAASTFGTWIAFDASR